MQKFKPKTFGVISAAVCFGIVYFSFFQLEASKLTTYHYGRPLKVPTLHDHKIWIKVAVFGHFIGVSICFAIFWAG